MEKVRYGDGSVRPINATTQERPAQRDSVIARAAADDAFRAGLGGGGQGYGTRGGFAWRDLERRPQSQMARDRVTMPGGLIAKDHGLR